MPWQIWVMLVTSSACAAFGQFFFKIGASGRASLASFFNVWILLGLGLYATGTVLWIASLSRAKLTAVYPFTALTFVLVYVLSIFVLGESVASRALFGVAFVLLGLYLATKS
jgi:undecaprenyl phosphate-alpha-L-ara4N flippase subunit ArnE